MNKSVNPKKVWVLTGGMGSGKSTVLQMFKKKGTFVLDADQIVHEILDHNGPMKRRIQRLFGKEILINRKKLDKKGLATRVFASPRMRKELETLLHPVVRRVMGRAIKQTSARIVICDIPLVFETKRENAYSGVIVVNVSLKNRIHRLLKKGYSLEQIKSRFKAQMPLSEKVKRANFVVNNNGSKQQTQKEVNRIWSTLIGANP